MADQRIFEYVEKSQLEKLLKGFAESAGVAIRLSDRDGLRLCGPFNFTTLCSKYNYGQGPRLCVQCVRKHGRDLKADDPFVIYECDGGGDRPGETGAGLIDALVAVRVGGEHLANVVCGQVLFSQPNKDRIERFRSFAREQLGLRGQEVEQYLRAVRQVPVIHRAKVERLVEFLYWLANLISQYAHDHRQVTQFSPLMEVRERSPDEMVGEVLTTVEKTVSGTVGSNLWYFDGKESLVLKATSQFDPDKVTTRIIHMDRSICGRAIREGTIQVPDVRNDPDFADRVLIEANDLHKLVVVPFKDLAGGQRHLGAIALFLAPDAPAPSDSILALVSQVRGVLENALHREGEKHRTGVIAAAADLLTAGRDAFWTTFDKIVEETLPNVTAYVLYKIDQYREGFVPERTRVFAAERDFDHGALRKFCRYVFEGVREQKQVVVWHDVLGEDVPEASRELFKMALRDSGGVAAGPSAAAVPLYDNEQRLIGGLVCLAARTQTVLPRYRQCTVFAAFSASHIEALQGIGSVLSMALAGHMAEEARILAQTMRSHELVAPIHAIRGYHENLTFIFENEVGPGIAREGVLYAMFKTQLSRLGDLCKLLELVATAGSLEGRVRFAKVNFEKTVLLPVVQPLRAYSNAEKRTSIGYAHAFEDLPNLYVSADRMKRCLFNVVFNAVKYSNPHSNIDLTLHQASGDWQIHVVNEGIGAPSEETGAIFGIFTQGSNADTAAAYGAGLGLYVARAIARSHGGDVRLLDPSPERTTFAIILPESLASEPPAEVPEES